MAASIALREGTVIGGHTIGPVLGKGGFGITYLARHNASGDQVAIKEYFPSDFANRNDNGSVSPKPDGRKVFQVGYDFFLEEANMLKELPRHPNLVRVRSAFSRGGSVYCVMAYIPGQPLNKMLPRMVRHYGAMPEDVIREFTVSMVGALSVVHARQLLHRDVKPGNVMLHSEDQEPVLIDFGAARSVRETAEQTGMFTRGYAALEQFVSSVVRAQPSLSEGPWSDLYSLSVVLYEMVARVPPHLDAEERLKAFLETGEDPYVPVADMITKQGIEARYSPDLLRLIDRGCALFPKDRPRDGARYLRIIGERVPPPPPSQTTGGEADTPFVRVNRPRGAAAQDIADMVREARPVGGSTLGWVIALVTLIVGGVVGLYYFGVFDL